MEDVVAHDHFLILAGFWDIVADFLWYIWIGEIHRAQAAAEPGDVERVAVDLLGGLVGTGLRLATASLVAPGSAFPWSTLLVNVVGSFALGFLVARVWPTALAGGSGRSRQVRARLGRRPRSAQTATT